MNCNCRADIEAKLTERHAQQCPEAKNHKATLEGYAMGDPTHYDRARCPHCNGTGWALWTEAGREDYVTYLKVSRGMSETNARAAVNLIVETKSSAERTST